jgi:murein L,D-transpeptidase YcbB/YkuD
MRLLLVLMATLYSCWTLASLSDNDDAVVVAPPPAVEPDLSAGQFGSMIEAASYYLTLPQRGWRPLLDGPVLRLGQRHPQVAELRFMLSLYGDYQRPQNGRVQLNRFDLRLARALASFQRRHGLTSDAVLGPATRQVLNVRPDIRAYQLLLNHERQRELLNHRPERYIQVNLPEYRLRLFEGDKQLLEMKTIVGRQSRQTPVMSSEIRSLVVNPAWNVPRSIATQDILPKLQRDASYLQRNNMRVVSGWGDELVWIDPEQVTPERLYRGREYQRLYQLPGRNNALGAIKFSFPNSEAIYLHDTPYRGLFKKPRRALSSGCIRLENPRLLAQSLLASDESRSRLQQALKQPETRQISLSEPVELYLTYWTAWLDSKQRVQFREDIYRRDPHLKEVLASLTPDNGPLDI